MSYTYHLSNAQLIILQLVERACNVYVRVYRVPIIELCVPWEKTMAGSSGEPIKELYMAKSMEELNKKTSAKNMDYSTPKLYVWSEMKSTKVQTSAVASLCQTLRELLAWRPRVKAH